MTQVPKKNATAVVTGASSGIGKVYADRLAGRGYDLKIVARRKDRLEELAIELRAKYKVDVEIIVADLSKAVDVETLAQSLEKDTKVSVLINNAGTATLAPVLNTSPDQVRTMNSVNVSALYRLTQAVLPRFKEKNAGAIVNIASVLAFHAIPVSAVYSGGKAGVLYFTQGLQTELQGTNIRVQCVCPASTATEIWDVGGIPISALAEGTVMNTEECVDAALAGFDMGELVTFPSVENIELWKAYETARLALFGATQSGKPASRYAA